MKAQAAAVSDGIPLELSPLLMPYGRDRRVTLRIERMPHRARLSRGRNNGDGSWSLTRDEIEGLEYIPPKGATDSPTLTIRVIGLDNDNGATLSVLDFPVLPIGAEADSAAENDEPNARRREEVRNLRGELAKTKAILRVLQSELDASRKSFDTELEERLNEAAAEAASALEERRAAWQAETRDRIAKAEARAQERLEQARKRWERDSEAGLSRAEEAWKSAEAVRLTDAEARWKEQSARTTAKETARIKKLETELADARTSASNSAELRQLHDEIGNLRAELAEGDGRVTEAKASAVAETREQLRGELAIAISQAESKWKGAEARRFAAAESAWRELSDRALEELKRRIEQTETELLDARAQAKSAHERRDTSETKRLRAELSTAHQTIAMREKEIAQAKASADVAVKRAEEFAVAVNRAEAVWKKDEAKRLAAAEARWSEQSARTIADISTKLQRNEAALAKTQAEIKSTRDRRDDAELRRLNDALADAQAKLSKRQADLAQMQTAADDALARTSQEFENKLARAKEEWAAHEATRLVEAKTEWKTHSDRLFKQATLRLEGAEAALAEARAAANTAQDRREGAELKRLRIEFAAAREKLSEREIELAEAKVAAGRERERNRGDVESALAKAEESWRAAEAVRIAEIETRERERGARALAEAMGRLERTEAALNETRGQLETARERGMIMLAETRARLEKTESALQDARNQIESMRDPANEGELSRLRAGLASVQVAIDERDAELAEARSSVRRSREEANNRIQAAVMRARDEWRADEERRMDSVRRHEESDTRLKSPIELRPDKFGEPYEDAEEEKQDKRLAIDIALAAALAVLVVGGVTFYPRIGTLWSGTPGGAPIGMTRASASVPVHAPAPPVLPEAVVTASTARLRASPSADAHVIATMARGSDVTLVGENGSWMHVRVSAEPGKPPREGWIHTASLKSISSTRQESNKPTN
jgi:hypothetical protein